MKTKLSRLRYSRHILMQKCLAPRLLQKKTSLGWNPLGQKARTAQRRILRQQRRSRRDNAETLENRPANAVVVAEVEEVGAAAAAVPRLRTKRRLKPRVCQQRQQPLHHLQLHNPRQLALPREP
jgi:hypothetical protein